MKPPGSRSGELPKVLINCDDLGMHPTINDAIVEILGDGIVKSASLMAVGNFFEDAVRKLTAAGVSEIGVHLTLGSEYPGLPLRSLSAGAAPTLVGDDGTFHADIRVVREQLDAADIRRELWLQIDRVRDAGLRISHLDGHMFFYDPDEGGPEVHAIVRSLARSLEAPLRDSNPSPPAKRFFLWEETPDAAERIRRYREWFSSPACHASEVIIHPAKVPALLRPITRSADWRHADYVSFREDTLSALVRGQVDVLSVREMAACWGHL